MTWSEAMTRRKSGKAAPQTPREQALALGFSPMTAQRCADLVGMGRADPQDAVQPEADFFVAYAAARARAGGFREQVEAFGARLGGASEGVLATVRPGDVKTPGTRGGKVHHVVWPCHWICWRPKWWWAA